MLQIVELDVLYIDVLDVLYIVWCNIKDKVIVYMLRSGTNKSSYWRQLDVYFKYTKLGSDCGQFVIYGINT